MSGKMNIERRIFLLMLLTGLLCFFAFEAVSLFGLYDVRRHTLESVQETTMPTAKVSNTTAS